MDTDLLANQFLEFIDTIVGAKDGKWSHSEFKTSHGFESRNGFLDACSELFPIFAGQPKPIIYAAIQEAFRRRGKDSTVQRYGGMVLLNLVGDVYGQVDKLIDIVSPVYDLSNGEIAAFLVEQVGLEPLLQKLEVRKATAENPDILTRLNGIAYQARAYQSRKDR